jgi:hypothetical protein
VALDSRSFGNLNKPGVAFIVVIANDVTAYQAGEDCVIQFQNYRGTLTRGRFHLTGLRSQAKGPGFPPGAFLALPRSSLHSGTGGGQVDTSLARRHPTKA